MTDLQIKVQAEITRIKGELSQQKKIIKNSGGNKLVVETAEAEMKALHARLSTLEATDAKEAAK